MISSYKPDFRLLVVFDQSKAAHVGLQNAINFAKPINGAIDILYINRLSNVKKTENCFRITPAGVKNHIIY